MNWYSGSIAEAVSLSKAKNAIFVVYVEGDDDQSQKLRGFINEEKIKRKLESEHFVAVRIESGSEAYMQFAQIYQLVPLPSLFFIGKTGAPIEIATGVVASLEELDGKINRVLSVAGFKIEEIEKLSSQNNVEPTASIAAAAASASTNLISSEQAAASSSDIVCEGEVCYRKTEKTDENKETTQNSSEPKEPEQLQSQPEDEIINQTADNTAATEEKIERAKQLLEEKRKENEAEEARLEREREIKRRKEGQDLQTLKQWKHEHELKELKDNIRKEKLEDQAARQRILEKIASDKAERAQKFSQISTPKPEQQPPKPVPVQKSSQDTSEFSRIQFRKPDGESEMSTFKSSDNFQVVRDYVKETLLKGTGIREFSLAMTFPRKEFTTADDNQSLTELGLCPTAVLLVITRTNTGPAAVVARSGGVVNIFNTVFWGILSPFFAAFGYIKSLFTGQRGESGAATTGAQKRANENVRDGQDSAKKRSLDRFTGNGIVNDFPSTSGESKQTGKAIPYRRVGSSNIHRLRDQRDSDDENNTWNGNSTQQQ